MCVPGQAVLMCRMNEKLVCLGKVTRPYLYRKRNIFGIKVNGQEVLTAA